MNIEEIKDFVYEVRTFGITSNDAKFVQITEYLLSELEKEKGENVKLRLQDIPLIEGELKAYKDRVNELKQELEKEKEKNKKAIDFINDKNNYFEDGENWQNVLKIKKILEE